jgi:UDP-glucose 4-epimerase
MRIFITGAAGFLGAYVTRRFLQDGHDLALLLRPTSDTWRIAGVLPRVKVIRTDLSKLPSTQEQLDNFAPQAVVHLAWAGVGNRHHNEAIQAENVQATRRLLETAGQAGAKAFVATGSQAEYGPCNGRVNEEQETRPTTEYGRAKLQAHGLCQELCGQFKMRLAWLRIFSTYGPMDDPAWMIPYVILQLLDGKCPALTAGTQTWDYIYASDAAEAICRVTLSTSAEGIFNLGSAQPRPLRAVIEYIRDLIDPALPLGFGQVAFRPDQVMHLEADIRRLHDTVGWSPAVSLEDGLARTVQWWRANRDRGQMQR